MAEEKANWTAKDSVFIDMFSIPKFRLQLFQTLHPEMKDVKEDDIKTITVNPVLIDRQYNDVGLLIKDRLMIFLEAQSTWSINILIRILLYLAMTYHDYITENELNVYKSKRIAIPKPEFFVIYSGDRKNNKDFISIRKDFWKDETVPFDLVAKVIYAENEGDIIGQYIIFCHVLNEQIKQHGRTMTAVSETIRICKDRNVLKEYLESREKEVINIMITLFDQEYAMKAYLKEEKRNSEIKGTVGAYQDFGWTMDEATKKVASKFNLSEEDAKEYVEEFWTVPVAV